MLVTIGFVVILIRMAARSRQGVACVCSDCVCLIALSGGLQGELAAAVIDVAEARADATAVCEHAATLQVGCSRPAELCQACVLPSRPAAPPSCCTTLYWDGGTGSTRPKAAASASNATCVGDNGFRRYSCSSATSVNPHTLSSAADEGPAAAAAAAAAQKLDNRPRQAVWCLSHSAGSCESLPSPFLQDALTAANEEAAAAQEEADAARREAEAAREDALSGHEAADAQRDHVARYWSLLATHEL